MSFISSTSYSAMATVAISSKSHFGKSVHLSVIKKAILDLYGLHAVHRPALKKALASLVSRNVLVKDAQKYKLTPTGRDSLAAIRSNNLPKHCVLRKKTSKTTRTSPKASTKASLRKASDNQGRKQASKSSKQGGKRASRK